MALMDKGNTSVYISQCDPVVKDHKVGSRLAPVESFTEKYSWGLQAVTLFFFFFALLKGFPASTEASPLTSGGVRKAFSYFPERKISFFLTSREKKNVFFSYFQEGKERFLLLSETKTKFRYFHSGK